MRDPRGRRSVTDIAASQRGGSANQLGSGKSTALSGERRWWLCSSCPERSRPCERLPSLSYRRTPDLYRGSPLKPALCNAYVIPRLKHCDGAVVVGDFSVCHLSHGVGELTALPRKCMRTGPADTDEGVKRRVWSCGGG